MVFNAQAHRDYLHSVQTYVTSPTFLLSFGWDQDGSANVLVDKRANDLATVIVVGKVMHDHIFCRPMGTWFTGNHWGCLRDTKYQLTLHLPNKEIFVTEFDNTFKTLRKVQASIAATHDWKNLLLGEDENVNNICFSTAIFEERDTVRILQFVNTNWHAH